MDLFGRPCAGCWEARSVKKILPGHSRQQGSADVGPPSGRAIRRFEVFTRQVSPDDVPIVGGKLDNMNRGPVKEIWGKVRALWEFALKSDAEWSKKAIALAALVYLVTPFDAVPDFTPILGLLDDVSVILFAAAQLAELIKEFLREAAEQKAKVEIEKH